MRLNIIYIYMHMYIFHIVYVIQIQRLNFQQTME